MSTGDELPGLDDPLFWDYPGSGPPCLDETFGRAISEHQLVTDGEIWYIDLSAYNKRLKQHFSWSENDGRWHAGRLEENEEKEDDE